MDLQLDLDARSASGKANKRLRRGGIVPGVVYGTGSDSVPVQLDVKTFETLYRRAGRTSVVKLKVPGKSGTESAIIKSVQRHPVSGSAIHVDFLRVDLKHEMEVDVPLVFIGTAPAVEETGGTLVTQLERVRVRALPNDIPHELSVDVSPLVDLDAGIHVSDLASDGAFTIVTDAEELIAKVLPPRVEAEPEVAPEVEGELPEGEAAEAAAEAGEAPPAEGEEPAPTEESQSQS
jgi:large subunit ribosomal protein L25